MFVNIIFFLEFHEKAIQDITIQLKFILHETYFSEVANKIHDHYLALYIFSGIDVWKS